MEIVREAFGAFSRDARTGGRGKQSGVEVEMDFSFVFAVRNEKIVEMQIFMREDQALKAAGRSE